MNKTLKGNRALGKALNWLLKNAEKPPKKQDRFKVRREVLEGFCVSKQNVTATDGYRLVSIPTPPEMQELIDEEPVPYRGDIPVRDFNAVLEPIISNGRYPDFYNVLPKGEHTFQIAVNPQILRTVLEGFEDSVILRFYGEKQPFEVLQLAGIGSEPLPERYALVMIMHMEDYTMSQQYWRPRDA